MNEKLYGLRLVQQEGWVERFIQCQLRGLEGAPLSAEEVAFVNACEALAQTLPGLLEESLLEYGLTPAAPVATTVRPPKDVVATSGPFEKAVAEYGVAADTLEPAYPEVVKAIEEEREFVCLEVEGHLLEVLQIVSRTGPLRPCFLKNYTYVVARETTEPQTVTPYGGIYLSLEELKSMVFELKGSTIWLYHPGQEKAL